MLELKMTSVSRFEAGGVILIAKGCVIGPGSVFGGGAREERGGRTGEKSINLKEQLSVGMWLYQAGPLINAYEVSRDFSVYLT